MSRQPTADHPAGAATAEPDEDPRVTRSKHRILSSCLDVMEDRGVASTTIEEISERSGVAKTTIYRHWPDRSTLVIDALGSLLDDPVDPDDGSFAADLTVMAHGLRAGLDQSRWSALLPSIIDAAEHDPELARLHEEMTDRRHAVIRAVVARARARGEIRPEVTDDDVIELVAGPLFYRRLMTGDSSTSAHTDRLVTLVLSAVAASDG